ncbi:cysteine desulfurase [Candidatus Gottesmanbacteria bacterium]|nr:cysteine desulfurase [Candidatus Gottesmanbacteria bacterium]
MLSVTRIRQDFPILKRKINGHPLVYFDNAATSQKPQIVIDAIKNYYENYNANVHRGVHTLANEATMAYEESREKIKKFINAKSTKEIIFTKNDTEAINLVAYAWGRNHLKKGDEILLSVTEHHSNLVPWQILAKEKGAKLKFIDIDKEGNLDLNSFIKNLNSKTKLVALVWISNTLGTINPVAKLIKLSHQNGSLVLIDGAQYVPHQQTNVQKIDCDFLVFTGHKMLGPMGTGVLYAKEKILEEMPPFLAGGDMIREVYLEKTIYNDLPYKFEAGTPNVGDFIALGTATTYLNSVGLLQIRDHEKKLTLYTLKKMSEIKNVEIYGPSDVNNRGGIVAFNIAGVHPHDVASIFDDYGIAIRSGHHCTMPLHQRLKLTASCRASFYLYNTTDEIDCLLNAILKVKKVFGVK